jgi:hypothetical protein
MRATGFRAGFSVPVAIRGEFECTLRHTGWGTVIPMTCEAAPIFPSVRHDRLNERLAGA